MQRLDIRDAAVQGLDVKDCEFNLSLTTGRYLRGFNTKIHLHAEGERKRMALLITAGWRH